MTDTLNTGLSRLRHKAELGDDVDFLHNGVRVFGQTSDGTRDDTARCWSDDSTD